MWQHGGWIWTKSRSEPANTTENWSQTAGEHETKSPDAEKGHKLC